MLKKLLFFASLGACTELFGQFDQTEFLHLDHVNYHNSEDSRMIADMNNDGLEDVVIGNVVLTIRYGNGIGLNEPILLPNGASELNIAASFNHVIALLDIDNNGLLDIILSNRCLLNFGYNNFSASQILAAGDIQFVKDYNNDGYLDVMFRGYGNNSDTHALLFNDGAGNFSANGVIIPLGIIVVSEDFNADGYTDIAYDNGIYFNDGSGNFPVVNTVISSMNWYGQKYATGDSDADGYTEIAFTNFQNTLYVLEYDPNGWIINVHADLDMPAGPELFFKDMNSDGVEDIVARNSDYGPLNIKMYLGNGDGTFGISAGAFETGFGQESNAGDFFDLDNDSDLDFLQYSHDSIFLYRNDTGLFEIIEAIPNFIMKHNSIPMALDLNGDGLIDISTLDYSNNEVYLINEGVMVFGSPNISQLIEANYLDYKVLNFTDDTFPDIVFLTENQLFLMRNSEGNYFFNPTLIAVSSNMRRFELADFDLDSDLDFFYSKKDGSLWFQENLGNNIFGTEMILLNSVLDLTNGFEVIVRFAIENFSNGIYPDIFLVRNFALGNWPNMSIQNESYFLNNEFGLFEGGEPILGSPIITGGYTNTFTALLVGDFNHDGFQDLVQDFNGFKFYVGDGQGNFSMLSYPISVGWYGQLKSSNIDGDNNLEFLFEAYDSWSLIIGEIDSSNNLITDTLAVGVTLLRRFLDMNNDSYDDIMLGWPPDGNLTLLMNDTHGNFLNYGTYIMSGSYMNDEISQVDMDNDTDRDLVWINSVGVMLARSNGQAISSIQVSVYVDENENGVNDNEPILSGVPISIQPPQQTYYTNGNGSIAVAKSEGEYFVNCLTPSSNWILSDYSSDTILVTNQSQIFAMEFGLKPNGVVGGIQSSFQHFNALCADTVHSSLSLFNEGNVRGNIVVTMNIDSNCALFDATPAYTSLINNIVVWEIDSISYQSNVPIAMTFTYPGIDSLGLILNQQIFIYEYFQEQLVFSDSLDIEEIITCSYDPNDITENNGHTDAGYILDGDQLEYTIRFQNTGNAPAQNVRIENQLSELLQRTSLQPIAWSHNFELMIDENAKAVFTLNNINLPDSTNNEAESHGFITYRILPVTGLAAGTVINNTAEIYFDFNPAIITNTEINTIYDCIDLQQGAVSETSVCSGEEISCGNNAIWIENLSWSFNGNDVGTGNYTHSVDESGTLTMQASNALCDYTQNFELIANTAEASFVSNGNMLTANDATSYQWYLDGNEISGATQQNYEITETGNYSVMVVDENGCDGVSEPMNATYTGLNNVFKGELRVFPNPVLDFVNLQVPSELIGEDVKVTNALGEVVIAMGAIKSEWIRIDCSQLSRGCYYLAVGTKSRLIVVQ